MANRNHVLAFFLSLIPGVGFLYMDRKFRGFMYGFLFFGSLAGGAFFAIFAYAGGFPTLLAIAFAAMVFFVQMIDMVLLLLKGRAAVSLSAGEGNGEQTQGSERFFTLLLSFVPGLGHFHLGLMNRGLTFLIAFFGSVMMVFFIVILTSQIGFMIFLGIVMVIWILNMFDVVQLLNKRENGEVLQDRTILEDFEEHRDSGKKSRSIALMLSVFPGAGHMYLGLQRRGLQLMAAFLLSIFLIDFMRLPIFMFFIPLIWFFSFFDAMQKVSQVETGELEDTPIVAYLMNKQKWIGIGLVLLGFYYLFDRVFMPELFPLLTNLFGVDMYHLYSNYVQVTIVCLILIGGGFKLIYGSKKKGDDAS